MEKIVLIDGNSILNRAFYGIMGNSLLMTKDGTYTNAVYGFLAIMFKIMEDIKPEYMVVAFDMKAPTARHLLYKEYKGTRKGMPDELAMQMPILKDVLKAMNIKIIEKEGYEADDILGTLAKYGEKKGLKVTILSGDRDTFQLATDNITIRIPRTKAGKTEEEDFDKNKVIEVYGIQPKQLIEVKGLMGDKSDNIPGIPGIGEKTAINLIKEYKTIEKMYEKVEAGKTDIKGRLKDKILENKELAFLSKTLGTINLKVPIDEKLDSFKVVEWNKKEVYNLFKKLNFNRYIERFNLKEEEEEKLKNLSELYNIIEIKTQKELEKIKQEIENEKRIVYYFETKEKNDSSLIIKQEIKRCFICIKDTIYYLDFKNEFLSIIKEIFENNDIEKIGYKQKVDYILLKQIDINITFFSIIFFRSIY